MVKIVSAIKKKKQTAFQKTVDPTIGVRRKKKSSKKQKEVGKQFRNKMKIHKNDVHHTEELPHDISNNVEEDVLITKKKLKKNINQFHATTSKKSIRSYKQSLFKGSDKQRKEVSLTEEDESTNLKNKLKLNKKSSFEEIEDELSDDDALMKGSQFMGDISEEDIDSDDDLSLDESELPLPPDATTTEEESSDEEQDDIGPVDHRQPDEGEQRTIFVGNLPKSVNKSKLKKWFAKYGAVESVRLRCAPLADPTISKKLSVIKKAFHEERNNIHGFVRFSCMKEARNALSANGELFDETHHLRVDMAGLTNERKRYDDKKALFIGNLPFNAEEEQLRDIFADCGDILGVRIVRDKNTAVGKGFGFINFAGRHSVRLALEKDGIELKGRKLRLQKTFYNQELHVLHQTPKNNNRNNKSNRNLNWTPKFKKKKRVKENEGPEFQGLRSDRSNKDLKPKKVIGKRKREKIKKILNSK